MEKWTVSLLGVLCVGLVASVAGAEPKRAPRPIVCTEYQVAKTASGTVALCLGGKRPTVLTRYTEVTIPASEGTATVRAVVGWR